MIGFKTMLIRNPTLRKALALIAHPLSLAALGLLLVNDHLFRRLFPAWWTGKLGDFAWLFFVPLFLAVFLSVVIPGKKDRVHHERSTFVLAFAVTGLAFFLVKTLPVANLLAARIFFTLTGTAPSLVLDPSDLLAFPGLFLSVWLWHATTPSSPLQPAFPSGRMARAVIVLPLAALVLMADAAAPDPGITCFSRQADKIYASAGYNSYVSQDGGLTWQNNAPGTRIDCAKRVSSQSDWQVVPGPQANVSYRYRANQEIQLSTDGGQTWQEGIKFTPISEAERMYYLKSHSGSPVIDPGPLDAFADPKSGNMLFAMGQQGVLIHTGQGKWIWSKGGSHQRPENFPNADALSILLGGMIFPAVELAFLVYATLALRWTKRWPRIVVLVLAWLAWLIITILFPPASAYSYAETISLLGILALAVLILPLAIEQTFRLARRAPRELPRLLILSLAAGLLYLLPYVLWVYNALPEIIWATVFALAIAAAVLAAGWLWHRTRTLP